MESEKMRRKFGENAEKVRRKFGESSENELNDIQKKIINILSIDARLPAAKIAEEYALVVEV